ncbi:TonB-dependent receptor family protein [Flavobacteriaceae bacterium S0825]|uniref:TonB-dependent receptor n=1 Tax=Gaetbulibacter sp. S0825 TaxID=2720084 RepID=UPI001430E3B9|nr:TonB-dependent receptor [Gaetbulibacter sp. S0825]MCK0108591.1 TonB-dependent receptor family protein [Flavobacteriaceae bacterium S0825]NIX64227.1 TonB-dependent receptor [Gaetbulibacter sp. S0825]
MKQLITAIILLVACTSFAQVRVEGVIKDSIGNPLELANVIAINQDTKILDSYGITNGQGRYKLSLKENSKYEIQVSYIGMKTAKDSIETKTEAFNKDFTLYADNSLDAIELTYEMPVSVRGDTLVYNADSFKTGTERKLEDVLENLPGVEINDDGQIEVEGKVVSKVMVEGKEFFDGDSKLATQNIPSNAVDKVQVLKNYAEIGQLSGVTNNQDNVAINIKLKEGKTNFWFGNITAGGGDSPNGGLYMFQPKLFYYSPNYSINVIGDLNNLGEVAFTRRDYFNFSGGFRGPSRSSGTNINLGNNNLGFLSTQNNRAKDIETKFGAANFSWAPNKALDLSGFAIFSNNKTEIQENRDLQYVDPDSSNRDERTESNTVQNSDLAMLKLSAKYKPNTNNQLDYDIFGKVSKERQDQGLLSSQIGNINQIESSSPYSINQNVNYYYTLDATNIFAFEAQHLLSDEDPFYNAILADKSNYDDTAVKLGLDGAQLDYNIGQDKRIKSNQLDAKLDYWNILNTKSDINFTLGTILSNQKFDSNIFQFLDNGSRFNPTPTINGGLDDNNIDYSFSDVYLGIHYRLKSGIFTFTPGVSAHAYSTKNDQFGTETTESFFRVLPDFNMRLQLKKSEQLVFNYRMQTQFTDVSKFARGLVLNNYNSLFSGNPELENALSHNVSLSYFSFNMFNYTNVNARIGYNKNIDNIRNRSNFEPGSVINISSPINSDFADESVSASGRMQRTFNKIRGTLSGSFNYSKFNQLVQDVPSVNESFTQNYRAQLRTNFRTAPNVEIGYRYTIQDNQQGRGDDLKYYTKAPSIEVDAYILKAFTFRTDYSYNNFSDEEKTINTYEFWNASLAYRKDRDAKFEYEIKATNLLDTRAQNRSSATDFVVSATEYFIQPRFVSFRLRYEL